jgi:O-antigen ligase
MFRPTTPKSVPQKQRAGVRPMPSPTTASSPVTAARSPYWRQAPRLAALMILLVGLRTHELLPAFIGKLRPAILVTGIGLILLYGQTRSAARRAISTDRSLRWMTAFVAWVGVCVPFALWMGGALEVFQMMVFNLAMIVSILACRPSPHTADTLTGVMVMGAAANGIGLLVRGVRSSDGRLALPGGTFDSNDMGTVMAMSLPLCLGLAVRTARLPRYLWLAVAVLLVAAVVGTASRGATIALLVGGLAWAWGYPGSRRVYMTALLLVAGALAWQFATPEFRSRIGSFVAGEQDYNYTSDQGRKQIWRRARQYAIQHPVLGVGPGNFPVAEGRSLSVQGRRGKWSTTHNTYLQAASELGIPGLLILSSLLVATASRVARHWRVASRSPGLPHRPELLACLLAWCTAGVFLSHAYFQPVFALLGLLAYTSRSMPLAADAQQRPLQSSPRH